MRVRPSDGGRRVLILLVAAIACPLPVSAAERPNVVLMMADDLGWGDVGFHGNRTIRTPELDRMARAGMRFDRFYAAAPVCSPTRGSCLTGRHPFRYGVHYANVGHLETSEWTLAEMLRDHGYTAGHFGKWHLGTLTVSESDSNRGGPRNRQHFSPPALHGLTANFSTEAKVPTWDPLLRPRAAGNARWWRPVRDPRRAEPYGTAYWSAGQKVEGPLAGDDSRLIMDRALEFVRRAVANQRPFLAVIWFHAPHLPVVAGPEFTAPYAQFDGYEQHYFGCISALDQQVGRLRAALRDLDVAENTLVCFCSDNGPEGNAQAPGSTGGLRGRKRSLFEGGIRVPGLAEWPGRIAAGSQTAVPACTSDYFPTLLELVGGEPVDDRPLDGVSLAPVFSGQMANRRQPIAFESRGQLALIDDRYKLIYQPPARSRRQAPPRTIPPADWMLFDLLEDRAESKDLAADQPQRVTRMANLLQEWRQSCRESARGEDYK